MLGKFPCLVKDEMMEMYGKSMKDATQAEIEECLKVVKKETMAALFLHRARSDMVG